MKMKRIASLIMASSMAMSLAAAPIAYAIDTNQNENTANYQWEESNENSNDTLNNTDVATGSEEANADEEDTTAPDADDETQAAAESEVNTESDSDSELDTMADDSGSGSTASNTAVSKKMEDCTVVLDKTSFKYDGAAKYPRVTVLNNLGQTLVENTDYTTRYSNNVAAGIGVVEVFGITYSGSKIVNFSIEKGENSIQAENVTKPATSSVPQSFYLNARAAAGEMTFSSDSEFVTVDKNGRVTVQPNFVGVAHITINASSQNMGNATKTIDVTIYRMKDEIYAKGISIEASEAAIVAPIRTNHRSTGALSYTFSDASVSDDGKGNANIAAGFSGVVHATVKSADSGAYEGAEAEFNINVYPKATAIDSVKIANEKGTKMKISWKKNETAGGYRIQYSTDGDFEKDVETINIQGNQTTSKTIGGLKAGKTYYVRIQTLSKGTTELTAVWSDTESLKVVSAPAVTKVKKLVNKKGKKIKVTWKKTSGASGYEIQYSTKTDFKNAKTIKVKSKTATSKTIKKLSKKTYYVRIRTVKTVDGNNFYAKWSGYKTIKVKK